MATAAQLQQQISIAQQNLSANQATLASLQSQYDAKVIAANSPGNSSMRANLLQDAEDLQVEIANSSDIVRRQGLAIADLNTQLQEAPVVTSDTAANKVANDPPTAEPTVATQNTVAPPAPPAEDSTLSAGEQTNLKVNTAGAGVALNNYDIAPNFSKASEVTAADAVKTTPKSTVDQSKPIPNPLLDYPSYTYGLSLAMLTKKEYNDIVKKPESYVPNRVIIASAGRYNNTVGASQFVRSSFFNEDFYFEQLNMKTVIGMNDNNRATNAVEISFSIMEPYGMTLLNRIIDMCASDEMKTPNYTEQPYMLQIDFFAINNAGEIIGAIPGQTKHIPIRILTMEIKASSKGSEYNITAAAYNHSAYDVQTVQTPAHFEIAAGTVASMFQGNEKETSFADVAAEREKVVGATGAYTQAANGTLTVNGGTNEVVGLALMSKVSAAGINSIANDPVYDVKSYASAINAWNDELVNTNKITHADKYVFNFHPDIANSTLVLEKKLSPKDTQMGNVRDTANIRKGNIGAETAAMSYNSRIFSINTGTSIDQVINFVMRNSNYIQDQLVVPEDFAGDMKKWGDAKKKVLNEPLKWFKIVPSVILGDYDDIKGTWARTITYNVIPYKIYNAKLSIAPQGIIESPVKEHNYWYTGKNDDILDFNVEFKALYYNATTAYKGSMGVVAGATDSSDQVNNPANYSASADPTALQKQKERPETTNSAARATGGDTSIHQIAASDVEQSLYSSWSGDMIGVTLKIIGDPQYIKQDDVFRAPNMEVTSEQVDNTGPDSRLIANGSLEMDSGEVYIQITFRTPSDIDEETGLMKFESKYQQSVFTGMYKVLTVDSVFSGGQFTQTLNIVRLPRQTMYDYVNKPKPVSVERTEVAGAVAPVDTTNAPPTAQPAKTTGDDKAPGSNPTVDKEAPTQTAEEKALAKVDSTAPETAITSTTEPIAMPSPVPPSDAKLSLKALSDQALADRNTAQAAANTALDSLNTLQSNIEYTQSRIARYQTQLTNPNINAGLQATATTNLAQLQADLPAMQAQLPAAQSNFNSLDTANKAAQTTYVNALDAYSRAA